jgi:hypothetical protein
MAELIGNQRIRGALRVEDGITGVLDNVQYHQNTGGNQTETGTNEVDITGLTALTIGTGDNAPDGTKTYLVIGLVQTIKTSGNGTVVVKGYVGSSGDKGDTEVFESPTVTMLFASSLKEREFMVLCRITPAAGDKFGLSIQTSVNGVTVYGGTAGAIFSSVAIMRLT